MQCGADSVVPSLVAATLLAICSVRYGLGVHLRNVLALDVETVRLVRHGE